MDTKNKTAFSDNERGLIALQASYEIEHMADLVMMAVENSMDTDALRYRGLAARITALNSVIMSAIGDESEANDELYYRLYLKRQPEAA